MGPGAGGGGRWPRVSTGHAEISVGLFPPPPPFWISRATLLCRIQSPRMPERWKHTHMTFYSSLMADRSCSHEGARLHTPSWADAAREAQPQPSLTLPCPRAAARTTLEMSGWPRLAHVWGAVSRGEKGLFWVLQKNETLRGEGQTASEQADPKHRARQRGRRWPRGVGGALVHTRR